MWRFSLTKVAMGPPPSPANLAEMAVWRPLDDDQDAGAELDEIDRHGMALLEHVGLATLVLTLVTGAANWLGS